MTTPARTFTPERLNDDGSRTITMKRCCNGCGHYLGDVENRDVDAHGNLTDVRAECQHCAPLIELEASGCTLRQLTRRTLPDIDDELDRDGIYAKGYWQEVDGKLTVTGLRIGTGEARLVAHWDDWIIRHPNGLIAIHKAPPPAA